MDSVSEGWQPFIAVSALENQQLSRTVHKQDHHLKIVTFFYNKLQCTNNKSRLQPTPVIQDPQSFFASSPGTVAALCSFDLLYLHAA
jgi:hypothetical protein